MKNAHVSIHNNTLTLAIDHRVAINLSIQEAFNLRTMLDFELENYNNNQ